MIIGVFLGSELNDFLLLDAKFHPVTVAGTDMHHLIGLASASRNRELVSERPTDWRCGIVEWQRLFCAVRPVR